MEAASLIRRILSLLNYKKHKFGWFGNFKSWEDALKVCTGYNHELIFEKVKNSLLKVKNGEAVYERDSVLFNKIEYSFPVLSSLLWIATLNNNSLNIIDYGGSLGSTYFQNRNFIHQLESLQWNIVEQPQFVDLGRKEFESDNLKFFYSIDDCIQSYNKKPDVILMSSVIQYLKNPYEVVRQMINDKYTFLLFDRTSFLNENNDRLTVQHVPPSIYEASYPCWFLNEKKFKALFEGKYKLLFEFESSVPGENMLMIDGRYDGKDKGFLFQCM